SWAFHLLPFIEQQNLYDTTDDAVVIKTPTKTYFCPTRRMPAVYGSHAKLDYGGNAGTTGQNGKNGAFVRQWLAPKSTLPSGTKPEQTRRLGDFVDGASQTLRIAEKQMHMTGWGKTGGDNEPWNNAGWDQDVVRYGNEVPQPDSKHPIHDSANNFWSNRFGASHPAGFNAARVDGSVSFV